jgi:hypothetical protein
MLLRDVRRNFLTEVFDTVNTYSMSLHSNDPGQNGLYELTIPFGGTTSVTFAPRFSFKFQHVLPIGATVAYPRSIGTIEFKNEGSVARTVLWFCIWRDSTFLFKGIIAQINWQPDQVLKFNQLNLGSAPQ